MGRKKMTVSLTTAGVSALVPLNYRAVAANEISVDFVDSAAGTVKVQYTLDDIQAEGFSAASATYFDDATITGKTADIQALSTVSATACRLNCTDHTSGTITMTVLEGARSC